MKKKRTYVAWRWLVVFGGIILIVVALVGIRWPTSRTKECEYKAIIKNQQVMERRDYEIPAAAQFGKGLILHVDDWGGWRYYHPSKGFETDWSECRASSVVEPATAEHPASKGTTVSIGYNLNRGYEPIVTMNVDVDADADPKTDEPYNMERVLADMASRYQLVREANGRLRLTFIYPGSGEDLGTLRGSYVPQYFNGKEFAFGSRSVDLVSTDGGASWSAEQTPN